MYIWIGCALPEDFEASIRRAALDANREIGANTAAFSLPQHISLKISFDARDRAAEILAALDTLLSNEAPFYVNPKTIEQNGSILWVTFEENERLSRLHRLLDGVLEQKFGIPQHPFDRTFLFHSTLFQDENNEKLSQIIRAMADFPLPAHLQIDRFLLGTSPNGTPGSYQVVAQISAKRSDACTFSESVI